MKFLDYDGLVRTWENIKDWVLNCVNPIESKIDNKQDQLVGSKGQILSFGETNTPEAIDMVPITNGGTGGTTAIEAMYNLGSALSTNSVTGTFSTYKILYYFDPNEEGHVPGVYYLPLTQLLTWANNRTNGVQQSNTSYTSYIARGIAFTSSVPSSITNGNVIFVYS